MLKNFVQQGRSRRKYRKRSLWGYVEDAFEGRTPLAGFFSILLEQLVEGEGNWRKGDHKHSQGNPSDNDPLSAQRDMNIVHRGMSKTPEP